METPNTEIDVLSLPDLVKAKKTQRDKDWPMIRRLVEAHYFSFRAESTSSQIDFWLREMRTVSLLNEVAQSSPQNAEVLRHERNVVDVLLKGGDVQRAISQEEQAEREADQIYWQPLKSELEALRWKLR